MLATLGTTLTVDGSRLAPMPWEHVGYLPLFDNVLVPRLALYTSLAAAVMVAAWIASRSHRATASVAGVLAIAAVVPNVGASAWVTSFHLPRFFTAAASRHCIAPGANILPLPIGAGGDANLWQVERGFRFTMAGGYLSSTPPPSFMTPAQVEHIALGAPVPPDQASSIRAYVRAKHVSAVVVDASQAGQWSAALDRIARPQRLGGVLLYRITGGETACD